MDDKEKQEWIDDFRGIPSKQHVNSPDEVPDKPGIYFIVDKSDHFKVKYVGQSKNINLRLRSHKHTGKFNPDTDLIIYSLFSTISCKDYSKESCRVMDETAYICVLNPTKNRSNTVTNTIAKYVFEEHIKYSCYSHNL